MGGIVVYPKNNGGSGGTMDHQALENLLGGTWHLTIDQRNKVVAILSQPNAKKIFVDVTTGTVYGNLSIGQNFEINAAQPVLVIANKIDPLTQKALVQKYILQSSPGVYGFENKPVLKGDLELIYSNFSNPSDIIADPRTQNISIADLGLFTLSGYINQVAPGITFQDQSAGYRVTTVGVAPNQTSYFFIGNGGKYGAGFLQTTDTDFKPFADEVATKLSQLENDMQFITRSYVDGIVSSGSVKLDSLGGRTYGETNPVSSNILLDFSASVIGGIATIFHNSPTAPSIASTNNLSIFGTYIPNTINQIIICKTGANTLTITYGQPNYVANGYSAPIVKKVTVSNTQLNRITVEFNQAVTGNQTGMSIIGDESTTVISTVSGSGTNKIVYLLGTNLNPALAHTLRITGANTVKNTFNIALGAVDVPVFTEKPVFWEKIVSAIDSGDGTLTYTGAVVGTGTTFKHGAFANKAMNGNNKVMFSAATTASAGQGLGLTNTYAGIVAEAENMDIWVNLYGTTQMIWIYEDGVIIQSNVAYTASDIIGLELNGNTVTVTKNGVPIYVSHKVFALPLTPIGLLRNVSLNSKIVNARFESNENLIANPL